MLNFATQIAREAGNLLVQRLGVAKITSKGDINLVTEADIAAENLIIERIRSYYPQHGILAEESGEAVLVGGDAPAPAAAAGTPAETPAETPDDTPGTDPDTGPTTTPEEPGPHPDPAPEQTETQED